MAEMIIELGQLLQILGFIILVILACMIIACLLWIILSVIITTYKDHKKGK